jgi:hypothetical protein
MTLNQLPLKVNFKVKQHIIMKLKLVLIIQHVVLNVLDHCLKMMKRFILLLLTKPNLIHTLLMVFQAIIQYAKRKL